MAAAGDHVATGRWEHFPHDADIGVRGYGASPGEACEQAALAMMAAILDPATVRLEQGIEVDLEAPRLDLMLVDWLNALIYEMAERRMVFGAFQVKIEDNRLMGRAFGEPVSRARHAPAVEAKGATYTELAFVEDRPGLWRAQCVIDV